MICAKCNNKIGMFSSYVALRDVKLCASCAKRLGLHVSSDYSAYTLMDVLSEGTENMQNAVVAYSPTKEIRQGLLFKKFSIDENSRQFCVQKDILPFESLVNYELLEDGTSITLKGGTGRAIAGGLLFGGAGAIVGASTAKRKHSEYCTSLRIKITVKNARQLYYIDFISSHTEKSSSTYKSAYECAQECLSALEIIAATNAEIASSYQANSAHAFSSADEIRKYKQLFDDGIITEEEFNAKKKQLLQL